MSGVRYTDDQKQEVVAYALEHSITEAHKRFGVSWSSVQAWVNGSSKPTTIVNPREMKIETKTDNITLTQEEYEAIVKDRDAYRKAFFNLVEEKYIV